MLTHTDVDQANKSYYGETGGFYLLSASGTFDCRVTLDKEGPVHDFAWSPNSKEFAVTYGCELYLSQLLHSLMFRCRHACKKHPLGSARQNVA